MPSVKANATVQDNVTLTAAAADTTSSSEDNSTTYGGILYVKLTNGATGPTVAAQVQVEVSPDDTNWYEYGGPLVGGTANNGVYSWAVPIDHAVQYVRTVSGSNTGQDVTLRVELDTMTHNR